MTQRKGQTGLDMLLVLIMIFVFGLVAIFGYQMIKDFNTDWQTQDDVANVSKDSISTFSTQFPSVMDQTFIALILLLWVALIVTSFLIDSHPAFFVITLLVLIIIFFISMELSNYFEEFMDDPEIASYAAQFPMTLWFMNHLLLSIIVMGLSAGVALYAKSQT